MIRLRWALVLALVLILSASSVDVAWGEEPSLENRLRSRVVEFWTAWSKNQREKVESMVLEADRAAFANIHPFQLLEFKVESVHMAADQKSATVETKIKRIFPLSSTPFDLMLSNPWVFENGDWFLHYELPQPGGLFRARGQGPPPSTEEESTPRERKSGETLFSPRPSPIVQAVALDSTTADFGDVPPKTSLSHTYYFQNHGRESVRVVKTESPCVEAKKFVPCVVISSEQKMVPPEAVGAIVVSSRGMPAAGSIDQAVKVSFSNGESVTLRFVARVTSSTKAGL